MQALWIVRCYLFRQYDSTNRRVLGNATGKSHDNDSPELLLTNSSERVLCNSPERVLCNSPERVLCYSLELIDIPHRTS